MFTKESASVHTNQVLLSTSGEAIPMIFQARF